MKLSHSVFDTVSRLMRISATGIWISMGVGCTVAPPPGPIEAERPPAIEDPAVVAGLQGDYPEAIRIYRQRLAANPTDAHTLYHLGYAHGQLGDHHREIFYYEKAIANGLYSDEVYSNLGMAHLELGQNEDAARAFERSLKINATNADAHFGLGLSLYRRNRPEAERALRRAVELDPQFVYFRENLALFYEDNRQWFRAAEQYERILEIDPENEEAQRRLDRISERLERKN